MKLTRLMLLKDSVSLDCPITHMTAQNNYVLKKVDGLNPPPIEIYTTPMLGKNLIYQGQTPDTREVVLTFELNPTFSIGQSISEMRQALYAFLNYTPKKTVYSTSLLLYDQTEDYYAQPFGVIQGYVKKIETPIFSSSAEVQITFSCLSPYIYGFDEEVVSIDVASHPTFVDFVRIGTATCQPKFSAVLTQNAASCSFQCDGNTMTLTHAFQNNDVLSVSTVDGEKYIRLTRGGVTSNIIHALSADSVWLESAYSSSTLIFNGVGYLASLSYYPRYWGV